MARNLLQDVVKVKNTRRERFPKEMEYSYNDDDENKSRYGLWFIAIISIIFLLFALSFLFSGAKITVNPKTVSFDLKGDFTAVKDSANGNDLPFDLAVISGEETKSIQGGEEKDVADPAKGTVVIYNTYSSLPQRLTIETRLEGSNGKIYKTDKIITVPGMGVGGAPGSIEVGIHAAEPGEEYNSGPLDFKIFGFKGTPKYSKFYARSKGEITGGFKGKLRQVSDVDKVTAITELKNTLQEKLLKKVTDQTPSGYILYKDAVFLNDDGGSMGTASTDGLVPIVLKGTLYGFIFEEKKLTKKIVETNLEKYEGSDIYIPNIRDLTFSLIDKGISFKDVTNIKFNLTGSVKFVWKVDTEKIVGDLLGKRKKEFSRIMAGYTNIDSADSVVKPIWNMSFPSKSKDIEVIVNYPQ